MKKRAVEECVEKIGENFKENSMSYLTESDLKLEIVFQLRNEVKDKSVKTDMEKKNVTNYKEPYIDKIKNSSIGSPVHTEVNVGERDNKILIDIGIFRDRVVGEIDNGTKRFEPECLEHALEIKFVKNKDNIGSIQYFENELEKFQDILDPMTEKYLLVFSNKNPLEEGYNTKSGLETSNQLEKEKDRIGFYFKHYYPKLNE